MSGEEAVSDGWRLNPWERSDRERPAILEIDEAQKTAENDQLEQSLGALPPELPGLAKAAAWGPVGFDAAEWMLERIAESDR